MLAFPTALLASVLISTVASKPLVQSKTPQLPLGSDLISSSLQDEHPIHPTISSSLESYINDPVFALLSLKPELAELMDEPRLIRVFGEDDVDQGRWMTEGDKLRLKRQRKGFMDITESQHLPNPSLVTGKASQSKFLP